MPVHVRKDPEVFFDLSVNRCDGTVWHGLGAPASNRRVFSTSAPQESGAWPEVFPGVHAVHARCVVVFSTGHVDSDRREVGHGFADDGQAYVEERVDSVACNDR